MSIQLDKSLSRKTLSRRLVEQYLLDRAPVVKPLISSKNKKCRLAFATEHVLWSQQKWQAVHFSDETKFMLFGSDGNTYVRRKVGEELSPKCIKANVKFVGGSVMVWRWFLVKVWALLVLQRFGHCDSNSHPWIWSGCAGDVRANLLTLAALSACFGFCPTFCGTYGRRFSVGRRLVGGWFAIVACVGWATWWWAVRRSVSTIHPKDLLDVLRLVLRF